MARYSHKEYGVFMNIPLTNITIHTNFDKIYTLNGEYSFPYIRHLVFRLLNPFLFYLYTWETLGIIFGGLAASLVQARILSVAMPFALLSLDYGKFDRKTFYGCILWSFLNILYEFYALWARGILTAPAFS